MEYLVVQYDVDDGVWSYVCDDDTIEETLRDLRSQCYVFVDHHELDLDCALSNYADNVAVIFVVEEAESLTNADIDEILGEESLEDDELYVDEDDVVVVNGYKYVRLLEDEDEGEDE
jgi:hypothetical protein